jgi:hypothetical protein
MHDLIPVACAYCASMTHRASWRCATVSLHGVTPYVAGTSAPLPALRKGGRAVSALGERVPRGEVLTYMVPHCWREDAKDTSLSPPVVKSTQADQQGNRNASLC